MTTGAAALLVVSLLALTGCCGGRRAAPSGGASGDTDGSGDTSVAQDEPPLQRMKRECVNGEQAGCLALGKAHRDGTGTVRDLEQARAAFLRACDLRSGRGCEQLARLETTSQGGPRDLDAAERHYRAGCEYDPSVCWNAAEFVELQAWAACGPQLVRYDRSKVRAHSPTLEQGSYWEQIGDDGEISHQFP